MKKLVPLMIMAIFLATATSISAQCTSNDLVLKMYDTFGDGWTGNELTIYTLNDNCVKEIAAGPFELSTGGFQEEDVCLPDGCYRILTTAGTFVHEISWELIRKSDNSMISSGQNIENEMLLSVGATADCSYIGCTDPDAENYDPAATCSFNMCEYSAPANDEACGALPLTCGMVGFYGTTEGATDSGINACKGYGVEDLWYTILGTGNTLKVTVKGLVDTTNMQITVLVSFGGDCDDPMICNSLTSFIKEDVNTKSAQWESDLGATYYINIGSKDGIPNSEYTLDTECLGCDNGITLEADYVGTERALMSWVSTTSDLNNQGLWICPEGVDSGDASCIYMDDVTSPVTINELKACLNYDIYLEQTCTDNEVVTTGPLAISTGEHIYNNTPAIGEKVCHPPCNNGIATYSSNEEIVWTLCTEEGMMPTVTFDYVDIESDNSCTTDQIEVIGSDYNVFLCGESQGDGDFGNGLSDGNCYFSNQDGGCVTVMFKSNSSTEETGFCFHFDQIAIADDTDCIDFATANSSVPVRLESFNAIALSTVNEISWITSSEVNNQWQIIEYSQDGIQWAELERVEAKGGSARNAYTVLDHTLRSIMYYRLVTRDFDGYTEVYKPEVVRRGNDSGRLSISSITPNPASDFINIITSGKVSGSVQMYLVDITGQIVLQEELTAADKYSLDLSDVPSGAYFLNIKSNSEIVTEKILITK